MSALPQFTRAEVDLVIPYNWRPRQYQKPAWNYWVRDAGRHMELVWHRRAGKDELTLHGTAVCAMERPANYWHMLPLANQVRKAIWDAVNPHTGKRRIDEAFPQEIRQTTRESEMFIKFKNGSTWQCLGSDNYEGAIGSTPVGIVYSEWAQSNPSSRGYLRPILAENKGWQVYITTPRGKNHAWSTYRAAEREVGAFAQLLPATMTDVFTPEQLELERLEAITTYGPDMGQALYEQEYLCSFDAAILGSYWGAELRLAEQNGHVTHVSHDPAWPVHTAWDLGRDDDTAIWWFQVIGNEVHILEFYSASGRDPDHYASQVLGRQVRIDIIDKRVVVTLGDPIEGLEHRQAYKVGKVNLPHDARAKTLAAAGKTIEEQFAAVFGWSNVQIVPNISREDGIQAARKTIGKCWWDYAVIEAMETLKQYQREWDDDKKKFKDEPLHDWTSHCADAYRYLAVAYQQDTLPKVVDNSPRFPTQMTFNEIRDQQRKRREMAE